MSEYTKAEALAFIDATRLTIEGKTGFRWMAEKLGDLSAFIESMAAENERMSAYLDHAGARADFEAFCAARGDVPAPGTAGEEI